MRAVRAPISLAAPGTATRTAVTALVAAAQALVALVAQRPTRKAAQAGWASVQASPAQPLFTALALVVARSVLAAQHRLAALLALR